MDKDTRLYVFITTSIMILSLIKAVPIVNGQYVEPVQIFYLDFEDSAEALKHLDTTTENYDSGNDGSSQAYIDETNGYLVFLGDNTDTTQGFDEPLVVVKGYSEADGVSSYAVLPYNYTVTAEFMVPDSPGYGNFYILPRYDTVSNKYEVVVDTEFNNLVFNYVKDNSWSNIDVYYFGNIFVINKNTWYRLEVTITWEYNRDEGKYMNHIVATVSEVGNPSNTFTAEVWDDNLPPSTYNGLAFLGFDDDKQFKVYMDNVAVYMGMEKAFEEPSESITPGDLDITILHMASDDYIYYRISLGGTIQVDATQTKYWVIQMDLDKDSAESEYGWDMEYFIVIQLSSDGQALAGLYDSQGNWQEQLHILGGGISYNYLVVEVDKTSLSGLGDSLYSYLYTKLGTNDKDGFPADTANNDAGDYVIYYLVKPQPTSPWTGTSDDAGEATPSYLDIVSISSAYTDTLVFFNITVAGQVPWYGGTDTGVYRVYIDADQDSGTGYSIDGIGADYMIEHPLGYVPKLWQYTGTGTDWSWSFVKRLDYPYNPGSGVVIIYLAENDDFTGVPLGQEVTILGQTGQDGTIVDSTSSVAVPIPEAIIVVIAVVTAILAITLYYRARSP